MPSAAFAQMPPATAPDVQVAQVQNIVVKGQALPREAQAASRSAIDAERIRESLVQQPEQLLAQVPGVDVRNYHLGGVVNVIAIRGFGGGAHGGDLGMMIDGIPLNEAMSHSDGYADLNTIVPLEIERFEVFRGPISALYGNFNRGGLIAVQSRRGGRYTQLDASLASFGTADVQAALGTPLGAGQFNGAVQLWRTGDFRPDSQYRRGTASARWTLPLSSATSISFSGRLHSGEWDSASYLLKSDFDAGNRRGKDARVRGDGGDKSFGTLRVDLEHSFNRELKLLAFAYGTQQDYTRFFTRPLNAGTWSQREEAYDRGVSGLGFSLNAEQRVGNVALAWVAGAEAYRERTDYLFFEGLNARQRVNAAVYDRSYEFDSRSVFGELTAIVAPWFKPTLGLRHDAFDGGCSKRVETGGDACAALNDLSNTSPKIGVRSTLMTGLDLRASRSIGFALPPGVAKFAPGGAALDPTEYRQNELAFSFKIVWVQFDIARYDMRSVNEVRTVSPGVFENFGTTRRRGTELSLVVTPMEALELSLVAAETDAVVAANANAALVGKRITGVPETSAWFTLAWRPAQGLSGTLGWRRQGDIAVNADNSVVAGAFSTASASLHWQARGWRAYAKLDNAGDRVYASNLFVIGGQPMVAPGAPRSLTLGVQADF
jgi:outer membrane receptor protein involved in Fe transport